MTKLEANMKLMVF